jgi:threonyl-tRNA synthetase
MIETILRWLCCCVVLCVQIEIIQGLPEDATISLYRVGPMVDLCHGPHLPSTGHLKVGNTHLHSLRTE